MHYYVIYDVNPYVTFSIIDKTDKGNKYHNVYSKSYSFTSFVGTSKFLTTTNKE